MNNPQNLRLLHKQLPPLVSYIYGLFKTQANIHEMETLQKFAGQTLPEMEQAALDILPHRIYEAFMSNKSFSVEFLDWIIHKREFTNYTYDLQPASRAYLISYIAICAGIDFTTANSYITELESYEPLKAHIQQLSATVMPSTTNKEVYYGRRLGWYAMVRAKKPKIVIESGVEKGMGSCVIAYALMQNTREGHPGRYYGLDIEPAAGLFFSGQYREMGELIAGDSATILAQFPNTIDFFIADSSHTEGYEDKEYGAIKEKLSPGAVLISDSDYEALAYFALQSGRKFLFWPEWPKDHFYPGAGIAMAFR